jgi:RNA polymerase sigma-70 factor (ECF subfamily)
MSGLCQIGQLRLDESMSEAAYPREFPGNSAGEDLRELQARFVQDNLRRIFLQIYRIVGNVDDAQDLTQETFIKALQRQDQIKDLGKAAHWLSRIASNTAIDFLRRHGRATFTEISDVSDPLTVDASESPERLLLRAEQSAELEVGLQALSVRERTALLLRDVDGLSGKEVAEVLQCSEATVRSHIANARIKFRKFLQRRSS